VYYININRDVSHPNIKNIWRHIQRFYSQSQLPFTSFWMKVITWLRSFIQYSVWRQAQSPFPKQFLHTVRSRASSLKWEQPLLSLTSSSNFLRLLPRLLVTSISPFIFPSITCFRRQLLRKMWPIHNEECLNLLYILYIIFQVQVYLHQNKELLKNGLWRRVLYFLRISLHTVSLIWLHNVTFMRII
jgi:hypothetical protein